MLIGELSKRVGIRPSAIRYYEQIGILPPALRENGRRIFDEGAVERLKLIRWCKELGFTLPEILQLVKALRNAEVPSDRWREVARLKIREIRTRAEQQRRVLDVLETTLDCGCNTLRSCAVVQEVVDSTRA